MINQFEDFVDRHSIYFEAQDAKDRVTDLNPGFGCGGMFEDVLNDYVLARSFEFAIWPVEDGT